MNLRLNCAASSFLSLVFSASTLAAPQTLVLTNGTVLIAEVTEEANGKFTVVDSVLGKLTLDSANIKSREPRGPAGAPPPSASEVKAAATPPAPDSNAPVWTRTLQLNYNYASARAPALGVGVSQSFGGTLALERATRKRIIFLKASRNRSRTEPNPDSVDNVTGAFQYEHILSPRYRLISRTTFLMDRPKKINHRIEELVGFGVTFTNTPKSYFMLAPGLGYSKGQKEYVGGDDQRHVGYGVQESFRYSFTPALSIEQNFFAFHSFKSHDYYVFNGYAGLRGQITPKLAMTIGFNITHDNQLPSNVEETDYQVNSGIQIKF
jgi:putative salt-induced outer membrane protein YdiY